VRGAGEVVKMVVGEGAVGEAEGVGERGRE